MKKRTTSRGRRAQGGFLLNPFRFGGGTVPEAVSLYSALVSYWEFEENDAGTTFTDAHGSNDLTSRTGGSTTATSSVTTSSGKVGRAYQPNGTVDRCAYIPRASTALDFPDANSSLLFWFSGTGGSAFTRYVACRMGSVDADHRWFVAINAAATSIDLTFYDTTTGTVSVVSSIAPSTTLKLFCVTFDKTNDLIRLRIKGGATDYNGTASFAGRTIATAASNANFAFGDWLYGDTTFFTGTRQPNQGNYDQACYLSKAVSDGEFDYLYNSGSGRSYAQLVADAT